MSEAIDLTGFTGGKTCPMCGKDFIVLHPHLYTYRRKVGGLLKYFCSYSCVRKFDKEEKGGVKPVGIVFNEKNQKAIDIAMAGGDPIAYLRENGSKDAAKMWYYIRRQLKERAPELYEKLPSCTKDCRVRNAGPKKPQKAEVPDNPVTAFPGIETPEGHILQEIPIAEVAEDPFETQVIVSKKTGARYELSKEFNLFSIKMGKEELVFDPKTVSDLVEELPLAAIRLGVTL